MKKGSFLVNNARGAICDPPGVVEALQSGQLRGELIGLSVPGDHRPLTLPQCSYAHTDQNMISCVPASRACLHSVTVRRARECR